MSEGTPSEVMRETASRAGEAFLTMGLRMWKSTTPAVMQAKPTTHKYF